MNAELDDMIVDVINEVLTRVKGASRKIAASDNLISDLGLASLDIAEVIALLEVKSELNPFAQGATIADVSTVGSLLAVYRDCASQ